MNHFTSTLDIHDLDPTTTIEMPKPELGFFNSNDVKGEDVHLYSVESVPCADISVSCQKSTPEVLRTTSRALEQSRYACADGIVPRLET